MSKVIGNDINGPAVEGTSIHGKGVVGASTDVVGVEGTSVNNYGVYGSNGSGTTTGVYGQSFDSGTGVEGIGFTTATGVKGYSERGTGIAATSEFGNALSAIGNSNSAAIHVTAGHANPAILAEVPAQAWGLYAIASGDGIGVYANSQNSVAVHGISGSGTGVIAESHDGVALQIIGRIQVRVTENPRTQIVGVAILLQGDTSVVVNSEVITNESLVLLTPYANPGGQLWVNVKDGVFAIRTSSAPSQDVRIGYLIIN
jgi:hypothetical protein